MNPMHMLPNFPHLLAPQPSANPSLVALFLISAAALARADDPSKATADRPTKDRYADHEKLVAETHKASLKLREEALRKTIAKDTAWPPGIWGDNLWTLSALYLNEKVDEANARLLKQANDYIDLTRKHGSQPQRQPRSIQETRRGPSFPSPTMCGHSASSTRRARISPAA